MQYSPKLKIAMEEIKAILNKHDIAGFVILHTPGFSEYLNHVTASYSCAKVVPGGIRLKLNSKEIGKEKAEHIARDTFNMIVHLSRHLKNNTMMYLDCEELLREKLGGTELPGSDETSHQQQNN